MDTLRRAEILSKLTLSDIPQRVKKEILREEEEKRDPALKALRSHVAEMCNQWMTVKPIVEMVLTTATRTHVIAETQLAPGALGKFMDLTATERATLTTIKGQPTNAQIKIAMKLTGRDFVEAAKAGREAFITGLLEKYGKQS